MTSTNETKTTTVTKEGGEQPVVQPEKKQRRGPTWIQTPVDDATFDLYQAHRKALGETWTAYILTALALRRETLEKRAQWREQKRRQAQSKTSQPVELRGD